MTVKELIQVLQTLPQDSKVKYPYDGSDAYSLILVDKVETGLGNEVILEGGK